MVTGLLDGIYLVEQIRLKIHILLAYCLEQSQIKADETAVERTGFLYFRLVKKLCLRACIFFVWGMWFRI